MWDLHLKRSYEKVDSIKNPFFYKERTFIMDYNSPPKSDSQESRQDSLFPGQNDLSKPEVPYTYQANKRDFKHSGPGIASFVIALVTFIGYAITLVVVGKQASSILSESNSGINESAGTFMFLGLTVLILAAVNVIGAVVGIIGLTLRNRRKVFAVIGTIINAIILLLFMLLISTILVNAGSY